MDPHIWSTLQGTQVPKMGFPDRAPAVQALTPLSTGTHGKLDAMPSPHTGSSGRGCERDPL